MTMGVLLRNFNQFGGYTGILDTQFTSDSTCQLQADDLGIPINHKNEKADQNLSSPFGISEKTEEYYLFFTSYLLCALFTMVDFTCGKVI
jgi:hypothetical protein